MASPGRQIPLWLVWEHPRRPAHGDLAGPRRMSGFRTTRWSLIAAARDTPVRARPAIEQLCRIYRPPVLAYLRRSCRNGEEAEDLAQAFFLHFIEHEGYARADPQRGRFRSLLLTSLRHFVDDHRASARAQRRNSGTATGNVDPDSLVSPGETPEQAFMRAWLGTVLGRAMQRLADEWRRAGRLAQFERLVPLLREPPEASELKAIADATGIRPNTLAVQLHRLRHRLRQLVRLELSNTVESRDDLEQELEALRNVLDDPG